MKYALLAVFCISVIAPVGAAEAKWTIMVFMNADNDLEPFAIQDFKEMAKVGSNEDVKVVVQLDRSPHYSSVQGDWKHALRFLVQKDMKPVESNAVEDLGEVNMGEGLVLSDFVWWAMEKYPAENYALIIWGHGKGWRFNQASRLSTRIDLKGDSLLEEHTQYRQSALSSMDVATDKFTEAADAIPAGYVVGGSVRYVSSDDSSADHLFNREIQDVIVSDIGENEIDLIGFDACLMAMLETGYAMRAVAGVMVGSEELEPGEGWNYELWLSSLLQAPNLTAEELGASIVHAFESHYDSINSETTLSALRLKEVETLALAVSQFADSCSIALTTQNSNIRSARDACHAFAPGYGLHGIDLARFASEVFNRSSDPTVKDAANKVSLAAKAIVIESYAGLDRQGGYGASGLGIYFPARKFLFDTDPDREGYDITNLVFPVQFVQDHSWDDFLQHYFVLNP